MERSKILLKTTRIYGIWNEGIVLDSHMLKSVFIGYDEKGNEKFEILEQKLVN